MNGVYALFFDYWLHILCLIFISGSLLIGYAWKHQAHYEYANRLIFAGIFLLIMVFVLSRSNLNKAILQTPQQTYFYLYVYQGKHEGVAFCFKQFNTEHELGYAYFMQKCLNDDWMHEQYNQLVK